ncbi:hypothetical protein IIY68_02965 [Candidatus Saccharibacteria bacterium]|nr:hypothetical protein [Candidatus Saccharibacteria bacterium]
MQRSKKQAILTNWDIYFGSFCYLTEFYDLFVDFINKRKKLRIPPEYTICIVGYTIINSDGEIEEKPTKSPPIVSIKKISGRHFERKTGFWWEGTANTKRILCAKATDDSVYYFRPRFASDNIKNCLRYISSSK